MYHKDIFCIRLKKLRKSAGEQQMDLGEVVGLSQAQISAIENGKQTTSFDKLALICLHYNVTADYLLGLTDEPRALVPQEKEGI